MDQQASSAERKARQEMDELAGILRVLGEPRRLQILYLLTQRELCVCEILAEMGISQPLTSHHLRVLAEAGLIRSRRQAQRIFYSIAPETLARLKGLLLTHFDPEGLPPEAAPGQARGEDCPLPGAAALQEALEKA